MGYGSQALGYREQVVKLDRCNQSWNRGVVGWVEIGEDGEGGSRSEKRRVREGGQGGGGEAGNTTTTRPPPTQRSTAQWLLNLGRELGGAVEKEREKKKLLLCRLK